MSFDVRTLYLSLGLIAVLLGLVQIVVYNGRRQDRWILTWGLGSLSAAGAFLLTNQMGNLPFMPFVPLANLLNATSYALALIGVRQFARRRLPLPEVGVILTLVLAAMLVPSPLRDELGNRILFMSFVLVTFCSATALSAASIARREALPMAWVVAAFYGTIAILATWRGLTIAPHVPNQAYLAASQLHGMILTVGLVCFVGAGLALMMMSTTRLQRELSHRAHSDNLTGLLNRHGFIAAAQPLLQRSGAGGALSLLLVDIDSFKGINDRAGHASGDRTLQLFAQVARANLRPTDLIGRYGGDEFSILLPRTSMAQASEVADRLRIAFATASQTVLSGQRATLSVGVAGHQDGATTLQQLLAKADAALYGAKQQGRNRTVVAESTVTPLLRSVSGR